MLQYLLNATAIWLISLVSYDIFLRKESYHSYNRFYLLVTFVLGALLPMLQWHDYGAIPVTSGLHPVAQLIAAKQTIVDAGTPATEIDWSVWVTAAYCLGSFVALCFCCMDVIKLIKYSRTGNKVMQGDWAIIETGKDHTPFSFRNTLFVCSRAQYSGQEWQMILSHESRHSTLFHLADVVLLQLAKIIFWFHPLVYVYNKRLLLVHEYQADSVAAPQPQVYARFLVEQALLQSAPSLSHSFNRSPIKNRIVMLTRKSSGPSKMKMIFLLPLLLIGFTCFTKNISAQKFKQKGNTFTYQGTKLEFSIPVSDTTVITDDESSQKDYQVLNKPSHPVKMNGKEIQYGYVNEHGSFPVTIAESDQQFDKYLLDNLKSLFNQLADGGYMFSPLHAIINEDGQLAYYELGGIWKTATPFPGASMEQILASQKIDAKLKKAIDQKGAILVANCPKFKILKVYGVDMPYELAGLSIKIRDHKIEY